jgi:hypothetical protein
MLEEGREAEAVRGNKEKKTHCDCKKKLTRRRWEMPENHKAQLSSWDPQ